MDRAAYIVSSAVYQISMMGGGAWFTFNDGGPFWLFGGAVLSLLASAGMKQRCNRWWTPDKEG